MEAPMKTWREVSITPEQVECYREKGYLLLAGLFRPEETAQWAEECRRLLRLGLSHVNNIRTVLSRTPAGVPVPDRMNPVVDISPAFKALAEDGRILKALRLLYDEEMRLFKDKIIFKMPGVEGYSVHQDYCLWQHFPRNIANVLISIDGADEENGAVEFFAGYHAELLSSAGEHRYMNQEEAARIDFEKGELLKTEPGDMIIFDCLTPHRSGANRSHRLRRQLYLSYSSVKNGDLYDAQLRYAEEYYRNRRPPAERGRLFFR
jgi:hypothetical protein